MYSRTATEALSAFISALFEPHVSNKPIAAPAITGNGAVVHFSTGSANGKVAHLVLRAVRLSSGNPFLCGRLFDGHPMVVAHQADDWSEGSASIAPPSEDETGTSALIGFITALFQPDFPSREILFRKPRLRSEVFLQFSTTLTTGDYAVLSICVTEDNRLEGHYTARAAHAAVSESEAWVARHSYPGALGPSEKLDDWGDWISWAPPRPGDIVLPTAEKPTMGRYRLALDNIQIYLVEHGFSAAALSRIAHYRKAVSTYCEGRTEDGFPKVFQAVYEAKQLIPIFETLSEILSREQVEHLLSGSFSPDQEKLEHHTPGRNYQFELYLAALCRKAGYIVTLSSPDIIASDGENIVAIEAKRIRSHNTVSNRITKAKKQLTHAEAAGIVALDVSYLYNPQHDFLRVYSDHRASSIVQPRLHGFLEQHQATLKRHAGTSVAAYLLYFTLPVLWVGHEIGSYTGLLGFGVAKPDDPRAPVVRELIARLGSAMGDE